MHRSNPKVGVVVPNHRTLKPGTLFSQPIYIAYAFVPTSL
ncbi:MAG: hypothetical protein M3N41_13905 [Acidobacteriota bacterium]|nr:hypothetical protein [Acidobacteriota bacterium]